jgi:glycosyltransferase involved in cell wall biosynthesis
MTHYALIPAFNEEENIEEVILRLRKHKDVNIIVIDDGSTDSTPEIVKKLGIILVRHETNRGKGEAIKTGFEYILKNHPEAKYIVLIDADMQYFPEDAAKILKPLEEAEADYVTGYRIPKEIPYANRIGNFGWRFLFNLLFGTNLKDTNCGYVGLTKEAVKKIKNIHGGYIIENSMLRDAIKSKLRIKQVPVKVVYKQRKIRKFARMFFGVSIFIFFEGLRFRLGIES